MASRPGILTEWPWTPLGNFKYVVLSPWLIHSTYWFFVKKHEERDITPLLIPLILVWRMLHNQLWISFSRYRTAKGNTRIVDKGIEFDQVDRERNWDDQIILNGILFYLGYYHLDGTSQLPLWRSDGVVMTILLHAGVVEFLYYWLHRALHHHFLYSRYHSHHHSSIVTEPITSVIHPFAEHISYFVLFAIPMVTMVFTRTISVIALAAYLTYIDFMNNMGHCNFEIIPKWLYQNFPPLKYLMYTPSFHSLHHTQFRTNYSLFMPFYDYIYGTMDKTSDQLHHSSLERKEESGDVVHLTHLTTPQSIYHLRLAFASLASNPFTSSKWYLTLMWPLTLCSIIFTYLYGHNTFILERNRFKKLTLQTWAIPKYSFQYFQKGQKECINEVIEEAILEAERKGTKVVSLSLMNQAEEVNTYGGLYVNKHPKLNVKVIDGSSLAVAIVLNTIPKSTSQVLLLSGKSNKLASAIASHLCQKGIQVATVREDEYEKLKRSFNTEIGSNLILSRSYSQTIWLVGDELNKEEQMKAPKGTFFIPYSQFPLKKYRKDCFYHYTPAMLAPSSLENVHSCENWLPRRVMSASRIAGIVYALEGWNEHECGKAMLNIHKVWEATLEHGFQPLIMPSAAKVQPFTY
ncbi:protein ECERIFERUM 1-like [Senna tora]|uniref:Protein ECERIFERUM 1-like n=1 Tax=Senna tora TaxID=362788 RepID=A0A834XKM6_9FABA|nr:protein ECERIFERUM 1-like [Senna tora]